MWYVLVVVGLKTKEIGIVRVVDWKSVCLLPSYFSNQNPRFEEAYIELKPDYLARDTLYVDFYQCGEVIVPKLRVMWEEQPKGCIIQTAVIARPLESDGIYPIPAKIMAHYS